MSAHDPDPVVPMPIPIVIVDGGPAAVSVTSTWPVVVTVNGLKSLPFTCTVPDSVSVVFGVDGVVVVVFELLLQPAAARASASTSTSSDPRITNAAR